jgi:hypothetical protein|tara:strand:- start:498 stop:668 length:171 start_codon:yes stop_codon:yes gene_type:complete
MMDWDWISFLGSVIVIMSVVVCWPYLMNIAKILQDIEDDHVTRAVVRYNKKVKEDK